MCGLFLCIPFQGSLFFSFFKKREHRMRIQIFTIFPVLGRCTYQWSPEQCLPWKCKEFDGSALQNIPNSSALKISFSWYLASNVGKVVSSKGAVISLVTFYDSPETSLKVMPCLKKMINAIVSLRSFQFELQTKGQGKYHLPFLPTSQPFIQCCKIFVIKCFSKFMSFAQKNRTVDGNVITMHQYKLL